VGKYRTLKESRTWAWWLVVPIVKPFLLATTKQDWHGAERIPETGGAVLALNHLSHIDPLTAAHVVWEYGRMPRYLAKAGLFKNKYFGAFLRAAGQIPVDRASAGLQAFDAAVEAVNRGELVVVYVEGSITKDPEGWPMTGKTGAARIALATGCPVIPVGQWGAQELLPAYSLKLRPFPRKTIRMRIGEPVPLDDLQGQAGDIQAVRQATDRIMSAIVGLVAELRGEEPPRELFDPRKHGVRATGNPNKRSGTRSGSRKDER